MAYEFWFLAATYLPFQSPFCGMDKPTICKFKCSPSRIRPLHPYDLSFRAVLILNLLFTVLCYMPQPPIFPCALGVPFIVMLNIMSSHIYRNVRFGYYRDYSITSSAVDGVIQGFGESAPRNHAIIFEHSTPTKLDLEVGVKEEVITSSRNSKGDLDPV